MDVLTNGTAYLCEVSIMIPSDTDTVVAYSRTNPDPSPIHRDNLDPIVWDAFGEFEVIGYNFDAGILHVMVALAPRQEQLEAAIRRFCGQLTRFRASG